MNQSVKETVRLVNVYLVIIIILVRFFIMWVESHVLNGGTSVFYSICKCVRYLSHSVEALVMSPTYSMTERDIRIMLLQKYITLNNKLRPSKC